jgi:lipopolysaccharide exporter
MKRAIQKIRNNEFILNVVSLATGSGLSHIITLAISPFLTRIYSPGDFGQFYLFLVLSSFYSILVTGSLDKAIIIKKSSRESSALLSFSIGLMGIIALLLVAMYPVLNSLLNAVFQTGIEFRYYIFFLAFSTFQGAVKLFQSLNNRKKEYRTIAASNIIKAAVVSLTQLFLGWLNFGSIGLIIGGFAGLLLSLFFLLKHTSFTLKRLYPNNVKASLPIVKRHLDFIFYSMPTSLINEFSFQLPTLVFKAFFGQAVVGIYALTQRVLTQPIQFIGKSVSDVFYRESAEIENNNFSRENLSFKTFKTLLLLGILPFSAIMLFGEAIFAIVFGSDWAESGVVASFLAPWMLLNFSGSPLLSSFFTHRRLKFYFRLNLVLLIFRTLALLTGVYLLKNYIQASALFGMVGFLFWMFIILYSLKMNGVKITDTLKFIISWLAIPFALWAIKLIYW